MNFYFDICAVLHIGHNNIQHNYTMANQQPIATEEQRNLGITITRDLKCQKQTEKSFKTSNRVLGFIARSFNYKSTELMLPLYTSPLYDPTWNMQFSSGHHIYVET